jgi:hypothetical protein
MTLCSYCEYAGRGRTLEEKWDDAEKHELEQHMEDLKEELAPDSLQFLLEKYRIR